MSDWRESFRAATESPPPAARNRVWKAMTRGKPKRTVLGWAAAVAVMAVAVVVWAVRPPEVVSSPDAVAVTDDARVEKLSPNRWRVGSGSLMVRSWGEPLELEAAGRLVRLESAVAWVQVASDTIVVEPLEGLVWVDGELASRTAASVPERAFQRLMAAAPHALPVPSALEVEAALVQQATTAVRRNPGWALRVLDEVDRRFPQGGLIAERGLTRLDALVALQRWPEVARAAQVFVEAQATNERRDDVRRVWASALWSMGNAADACEVVAAARDASWTARCR